LYDKLYTTKTLQKLFSILFLLEKNMCKNFVSILIIIFKMLIRKNVASKVA